MDEFAKRNPAGTGGGPGAEHVIGLADARAAALPVARIGGKAAYLARLAAGGARVPRGFVVTADAPSTDSVRAAIDAAAAALPAVLAVRSSASIEDTELSAAPGVFDSRIGVPRESLHEAIEAVRASASGPVVDAYAGALGIDRATIHMAVVVHELIEGDVAGTVYTRAPANSDAIAIELGGLCAEVARADLRVTDRDERLALTDERVADIARAALDAERIIGAERGADVELVVDARETIWLVQARPIPARDDAGQRRHLPEAWLAFSRAEPDRVWRWDAAHNPDPLSPAQIGLVEAMDRAGVAGYAMRVVAGHLYTSSAGGGAERPAHATALREQFSTRLAPAMEAALAALEDEQAAPIDAAIRAYEAFYAVYAGALTPVLSAARRPLVDLVGVELAGALLADSTEARLEHVIAAAARGDIDFDAVVRIAGPMSAAWDVAAPTFAETPDVLRRAIAAHRPRDPVDTAPALARAHALGDEGFRVMVDEAVALARAARDLGELDDRLYARAQAGVRRSLLALADRWRLADRDDVFFVPLDRIVELAASDHGPDPQVLHKMARAARAARERQRSWTMPLEIVNGRARARPQPTFVPGVYTGRGTGGRVTGIVARIGELDSATAPPDDRVLLVRAITPAMTFLMQRCAAVVSTHGTLLGHGAAIARELGIPCVVGCAGAWSDLRDGDRVLVDGDAGVVVRSTDVEG